MALQAIGLWCGYDQVPLLRDVQFAVGAGELVCLLGPNGVGKTTLFRTLLGILEPIRGSVDLDGCNIRSTSSTMRARKIAYVPQIGTLTFAYSAAEVAMMGRAPWMRLHHTPGARDRAIVEEVFETLALAPLKNKPFGTLSSGEKQLVLIARALVQTPRYLVLDEPMSNLDFGNQTLILSRLRALCANGLGIIMTTHHPNHAFEADCRVVLIDRSGEVHVGDASAVMTPENLQAAYGIEVAVLTWQPPSQQEIRFCISLGAQASP